MQKNGLFIKVLAVGGTIMIWLPLLAPVVFSVLGYLTRGGLWFDFLMPAELFPLALAGAVLLVWAAVWAHDRRGLILWSAAAAVGFLLVLLNVGGAQPGTWMEAAVLALLAAYALALAVAGIGGALLVRDLFRPSASTPAAM
jgi:hypothetical protein